MVEPRQSAMQRIQVGLVGLVVVLLFVSLANMVLDRVSDTPAGTATTPDAVTADAEKMPDEPLAELGVTPVAKGDEAAKLLEEPAENIRQVSPSNPKQ